ncbi:mating type protein A-alpha Z6 [Schizophyllum commune]
MSADEADIRSQLASAEADFLDALSKDDVAVTCFRTRWAMLNAAIDNHPCLDASTYALLHTASCGIAALAEAMISQEAENALIEQDLRDDLANEITAATSHAEDVSVPPLPPYIAPCYSWLLDNLHNPYPSRSTKERLLQAALEEAQFSQEHDYLPSPPSSPKSATTPLPKNSVTLETIDHWFTAVRARIGWSGLRVTKFDGSRTLMLQCARLMWGVPDEEQDSVSDSESRHERRSYSPKREELMPRLHFPLDTVNPHAPTDVITDASSSHPAPALTPDIEFAFTLVEERARELYAHHFTPSELAECLQASASTRSDVAGSPNDALAFQEALAEAAHDKHRDARRAQRQAKKVETEAERRAAERKFYPSPEPSTDDDESECDSSDDERSDYASDTDDDDASDNEATSIDRPGSPFSRYRTSWSYRADEDYSSDDSSSDEEDSESEEEDNTDDEEEEWEPPVRVVGIKRRRDEEAEDETHIGKKARLPTVSSRIPSPGPSRHASLPGPCVATVEHSSSASEKTPSVRTPASPVKATISADIARVTPPSQPPLMGANGVPKGTVRARLRRARHSFPSYLASLKLNVPVHELPPAPHEQHSQGIKVTGDPTPWVNWDLSGGLPSHSAASTPSLTRSPSTSSLSSQRSVSSQSSTSDTDSIFSAASDETTLTEPDDVVPRTTRAAPRAPVPSPHPLFDPRIWSNYDLSPPAEGHFKEADSTGPTAFVPTKLRVEEVNLAQSPAKHWTPSVRTPTRLTHNTAAPVVTYDQAVGTIASPTKSSFGQGQLTSVLSTGSQAGTTRRQTPPAKRRVTPRAQEPAEPSSLVDGILSSGLADVCKEVSPVKAPKKDRRYAERAERRASKSSPVDPTDTVRARLAEIEQQAARLEAERQSLQRIASVGG